MEALDTILCPWLVKCYIRLCQTLAVHLVYNCKPMLVASHCTSIAMHFSNVMNNFADVSSHYRTHTIAYGLLTKIATARRMVTC